MYTDLHPDYADDDRARQAADLISACVHCGFCLETCPTYLDRRDERDSPRGRIYLLRQLLQDATAGADTRTHLDRCLSCRSCETTCPSGMRYHELLDIGRELVAEQAPHSAAQRLWRWCLRTVLGRPVLFTPLLRLGQALRPFVPRTLRDAIPPRQPRLAVPDSPRPRLMLVLDGCVQKAATPTTNEAAKRVLHRLGIELRSVPQAGCCGALDQHLGARQQALQRMRNNIDAWWPHIEAGAEAIVSTASGCGAQLSEYGVHLAQDPEYAARAAKISELARDLVQVLRAEDLSALALRASTAPLAVHVPCTLQHALGEPDALQALLQRAGFQLQPCAESHLCCGSAGTHSILHSAAAQRLRRRKLDNLLQGSPDCIVTANVGCQTHLGAASPVPVRHWIELLDAAVTD